MPLGPTADSRIGPQIILNGKYGRGDAFLKEKMREKHDNAEGKNNTALNAILIWNLLKVEIIALICNPGRLIILH